jgi:hypothetical protein
MHLLHSPLCAPLEYLEKFDFITENEDRKYDHLHFGSNHFLCGGRTDCSLHT